MKSFKVQFFNKSGLLQEVLISAENESAAKKNISSDENFDMLICCKLV